MPAGTKPTRLGLLAILLVAVPAVQVVGGHPTEAASLETVEIERAFPSLSFTQPVHLTHAGDGTDRLWVVERAGVISVFLNDESAASVDTFLDIQARIVDPASEEGLLGLAFDPNYGGNGFFYVHFSAKNPRRSVISRFSVGRRRKPGRPSERACTPGSLTALFQP